MVVVVLVGVVRRHLLDAGGDAPHRLHVRLRGRPARRIPPFDPPSPPGSHAPSHLSLGARGALALALGPPSGPHTSVPLPVPWVPRPVTHALACLLAHRPSLPSMHLGALPPPLRARPMPWPLPGSLPCVAPSAARALSPSAAAGLGAPSVFAPLLLAACALARSLRVPLGTSPVASCLLLRAPVAGTQLCLRAVPSSLDHAPGVPLPLQLRQRAGDGRSGARGRTCRVRPGGKGLGGNGSGGLVWVWVGLAWARYFAPSLPTADAAAVAGEAPMARSGSVPRFRGVLRAAAWPAEAVARLAGAAVTIPRAPSRLPSAAATALGDAPGPCAGATPRVGGVPGAAVGAAAWLAGAAVSAPARLGPPPGAGRQGLLLGRRGRSPRPPQAPGSTAWCQRRPAGAVQPAARPAPPPPPATAPRAPRGSPRPLPGRKGSGSATSGGGGRPAGVSHWSLTSLLPWQACVVAGAPFPLPPGASVSCRGQCCAVLCGGEGVRGWGAGCGVSPVRAGAGGHASALGGEAGEPRGQRVAPQLLVWAGAHGPGPPGVVGWCRGEPH